MTATGQLAIMKLAQRRSIKYAAVAELADALDSGSSPDLQGGGSSPFCRTNEIKGSRVFVNPGIYYKTASVMQF